MKNNIRLRVRNRLILLFFVLFFDLNSPPLTRHVTCSRVYLDGKKYEEISDKEPQISMSDLLKIP